MKGKIKFQAEQRKTHLDRLVNDKAFSKIFIWFSGLLSSSSPHNLIVMRRCYPLVFGFRCHSLRAHKQVKVATRGVQPARLYSSSSSSSSSIQEKAESIRDSAKKTRWIRPSSILTFLVLGTLVGYEIDTHINASVLQRNIRTGIAGAQIALDYKWVLMGGFAIFLDIYLFSSPTFFADSTLTLLIQHR